MTTDFGLEDAYVGMMKGVILSINPEARIVDLSHSIQPQDIAQASFVLGKSYKFFPQGTVHVAVVDPGVGGGRRAVILRASRYFFVAPDNGVLSHVLAEAGGKEDGCGHRGLGWGGEAVSLSNPDYWLTPPSATFHGRDIFAPVAAHLSLGVPLDRFGESISSLVSLPISKPRLEGEGTLVGHVVHIDHFGNLITDIEPGDLSHQDPVIEVCGRRIEGLSPYYEAGGELLALIGSVGTLEIAVRNGSAARVLGAGIGAEVKATWPYPEGKFT